MAYSSGKNESEAGEVFLPAVSSGADFYSLASVVRRIGSALCVDNLRLKSLEKNQVKAWCHPFRAAKVLLDGLEVGLIAEVNPLSLDGVSQRVVIAELSMDCLVSFSTRSAEFKTISKYPDSFFEMSVVMPKGEPYSSLEELIRQNVDPNLLRNLEVVAVYSGKPLSEDEKSVSVKLYLGSENMTLSGERLSAIQDKLLSGVDKSHFSLRS
jgi:phenylalanyl-tRNA synthetase beta chain